MSNHTRTRTITLLLTVSSVLALAGRAEVQRYAEDFSSTQYRDTFHTTALWDTVAGTLSPYPFPLALVGSYDTPGSAQKVWVAGDHAFVADDAGGLQVVSILDPSSPVQVGDYNTVGNAMDIAIAGNAAYVADATGGLQVIDITLPAAPTLAGGYITPSSALAVAVQGNAAYVADFTAGLLVFNVTEPSTPRLTGSYATAGNATGVDVDGDLALVACGAGGLYVIDVADTTNPLMAGSCGTPGYAFDVAVVGDIAYVADGPLGLQIVDVTDPTNPSIVGTYDTPGLATGVAVDGDYVYVADDGGLEVIDASAPTDPLSLGSYSTAASALGVAVAGTRAYLASGADGLVVVQIASPTPIRLEGWNGEEYAMFRQTGLALHGNYLFAGNEIFGLEIYDVRDPAQPLHVGNAGGRPYDVCVQGDYVYTVDYDSLLVILDISDPLNPTRVGTAPIERAGACVAVDGDVAYVGTYQWDKTDPTPSWFVIDVKDPTNPVRLGWGIHIADPPQCIAIDGDFAYVANGPYLFVMDISDPPNAWFGGDTYEVQSNNATHLMLDGNLAYLAEWSCLQVLDVGDNWNFLTRGRYETDVSVGYVAVSGDYAFLAGAFYESVDVSDPDYPVRVDVNWDDDGYDNAIVVAGDYMYAAVEDFGIKIFEVFERRFAADTDAAFSLDVSPSNHTIAFAKLATTQNDSIRWELSADGGANWQQFHPGASWTEFAAKGADLRWRASLCTDGLNAPSCSNLQIDYLFQNPMILAVEDVANDQGRQVRVTWSRCGYDHSGSPDPVISYAVYRRRDTNPPNWDYLATVPATTDEDYATVVPTLADSTAEGPHYTSFFVGALAATPGVSYDSVPDSGYSIDNLAPHTPGALVVAYDAGAGNTLTWEPCPDADVTVYRVYRGVSADFVPGPETLVHTTASTSWTDHAANGWRFDYKVSAVDANGNESSAIGAERVTGRPNGPPASYALYPNMPNPFNPSTTIRYDVPAGGGDVTLTVYDVRGRRVRTLVSERRPEGRWRVVWDGVDDRGSRASSGVYFCRLHAGRYEATIKMVLLE
jgi:hypothetical protein